MNISIQGKFVFVIAISGPFFIAPILGILFFFAWQPSVDVQQVKLDIARSTALDNPDIISPGDLVEAEGSGVTEEKALEKAASNAIVKKVGMYIESDSVVQNLVLVKDQIRSRAEGYVRNVQVLEKESKNGIVRVHIRCEVPSASIWNDLSTALDNINLRSLFGHRRVIVVTPEDNTDKYRTAGLQEMAVCIESELSRRGFRLFKRSFARAAFKEALDSLAKDMSSTIMDELQKDEAEAGFVVFVDLQDREEDGKHSLKANAHIISMGRKLAPLPSEFLPVEKLNSEKRWELGAQACAKIIAPKILQDLVLQISRFGAGKEYMLYFCNYTQKDHSRILETIRLLKQKGYLCWMASPSGKTNLQLDIASLEDPRTVLQDSLAQIGLPSYIYGVENLIILTPEDKLMKYIVLAASILGLLIGSFLTIRKLTKGA